MMEQLYNDFVTKFLPSIQEGLSITKDYFFDLVGRYVKYLIIVDSIGLAMFTIALVLVCWFVITKHRWIMDVSEGAAYIVVVFVAVVSLIGIAEFGSNLLLDIYIPEIRIIHELKLMNH